MIKSPPRSEPVPIEGSNAGSLVAQSPSFELQIILCEIVAIIDWATVLSITGYFFLILHCLSVPDIVVQKIGWNFW